MSEFLRLAPALAAGAALGAIFFGGLWWTVVRGLASQQPALWFFASLMVRMAIALAGFYFVGAEDWRRWLACLVGFGLARLIVKRLTRPPVGSDDAPTPETRHAS